MCKQCQCCDGVKVTRKQLSQLLVAVSLGSDIGERMDAFTMLTKKMERLDYEQKQ